MKDFLNQLDDLKVKVSIPQAESVVFEMTGDPEEYQGMKHKGDFKARLEAAGWKHGSISKATILLTNDMKSNTGKMKKAQEKGITIMMYEEAIKSIS